MTDSKKIRMMMLDAAIAHAKSHIDKHRVNVEIYLTNPVGVGDHSNIMDAIEKELDEIARYDDQLEILQKYFL
jgi:hypothetical protein